MRNSESSILFQIMFFLQWEHSTGVLSHQNFLCLSLIFSAFWMLGYIFMPINKATRKILLVHLDITIKQKQSAALFYRVCQLSQFEQKSSGKLHMEQFNTKFYYKIRYQYCKMKRFFFGNVIEDFLERPTPLSLKKAFKYFIPC